MLRAFFTRIPERDLCESAPCYANCYECCYTSAYDFFVAEERGDWSGVTDQVRIHYERLEALDRVRAIETKRLMLRALCSASDGGAWTSTFSDDVIGYVPRLGVYYIYGRPALMIFTDVREMARRMPEESRALIFALFTVEQLSNYPHVLAAR
jgi:hypothetical protein